MNEEQNREQSYEVKLIREMDKYSEMYSVEIDGHNFEFFGRYYGRLVDPTNWQFGACPTCENVSGRTSISNRDFLFCLDHRKAWRIGINIFGEYREDWYADEVAEKNEEFLESAFETSR